MTLHFFVFKFCYLLGFAVPLNYSNKLLSFYYYFFREKMAQAYDFALDRIGMDIHSYSIWNDYVNFLKSVEAVGSYAENQKIAAVRKVYQRGIINPMTGMETLWKDYIAFEQVGKTNDKF